MAKLPADLPENWTQGEIISPNGTEVGLSEQHGYNYLMKQVNATQTEVNNVGGTIEAALKDVAKEASVQEIQDKIGETTDTGGSQNSGTVNAKLNKIQELINIDIDGNLTELIYPTTIVNLKPTEAASTSQVSGTYNVDVLSGQTEQHVYAITVQCTSPYVSNTSAELSVSLKDGSTSTQIGAMGFGNSSALDARGAKRDTFYAIATNISLRFYFETSTKRDFTLDWFRVERLM